MHLMTQCAERAAAICRDFLDRCPALPAETFAAGFHEADAALEEAGRQSRQLLVAANAAGRPGEDWLASRQIGLLKQLDLDLREWKQRLTAAARNQDLRLCAIALKRGDEAHAWGHLERAVRWTFALGGDAAEVLGDDVLAGAPALADRFWRDFGLRTLPEAAGPDQSPGYASLLPTALGFLAAVHNAATLHAFDHVGRFVGAIPLPPGAYGQLGEDGRKRLWLADSAHDRLVVLDPDSFAVLLGIPTSSLAFDPEVRRPLFLSVEKDMAALVLAHASTGRRHLIWFRPDAPEQSRRLVGEGQFLRPSLAGGQVFHSEQDGATIRTYNPDDDTSGTLLSLGTPANIYSLGSLEGAFYMARDHDLMFYRPGDGLRWTRSLGPFRAAHVCCGRTTSRRLLLAVKGRQTVLRFSLDPEIPDSTSNHARR